MSNNLKYETSPYLLQHSENPVNWFPWCEEAFEKAKKEDKPIFLSIGYSTCHWCHVMAHESFEDVKTAEILNENFISIKVDREERPDVDSVYMAVCQAITGSGGWPMSIFMTWDKKPFFAGTYFPVKSKYGMPGFSDLLKAISNSWNNNRERLIKSSKEIIEHLANEKIIYNDRFEENLPKKAAQIFTKIFDNVHGGFGSAPKFPTPHNLLFLILYSKINNKSDMLAMAEKTLTEMRKGGIFDHIGGGFSRYSTDKYFLAPHFEKMLYDNALIIMAYSAAYSVTKNRLYLETAEKTAQYILNEMTSEEGGFYSAQDADSEGVEGKYYTFSLKEIINVLGEEQGRKFAETFDITEKGNFEGVNIPNLLKSNDLKENFNKESLYNYRKNRFKLHLDDKILLSWNAMTITAFCMLYRVTKNNDYLKTAQKSQQFMEKYLCENFRLYTSCRDGKRSQKGFLDEYAFYIASLIELYNSTLENNYLNLAERFLKEAAERFFDNENGGFYLCDDTELFMNPKEIYDGAIPSGNSVMAYNFVRLYQLTEKEEYRKFLDKQINYMTKNAQEYPAGHCMLLIAMLLNENPPKHITIVMKDSSDSENIIEKLPFLANVKVIKENEKYRLLNSKTTYYICENNTCYPPRN